MLTCPSKEKVRIKGRHPRALKGGDRALGATHRLRELCKRSGRRAIVFAGRGLTRASVQRGKVAIGCLADW